MEPANLKLIEIFMEKAAEHRAQKRIEDEIRLSDSEKRQKEERREKRGKREKEEEDQMEQMILATTEQLGAFRDQLDTYDTATVQALMDNERALDEVRHAREALEAAAYRLPDGRMVFKSEDGTRVYDRAGVELSRDVIDPHSIPDGLPRSEKVFGLQKSEDALTDARRGLHQYQQEVDDGRDLLKKPNVTADEISSLQAALERDQPKAVRDNLARAQIGHGISTPQGMDAPDAYKAPEIYRTAPSAGRSPAGP